MTNQHSKQGGQTMAEMSREANCYCHKCKKYYHSLGIMRHRAMHRDKNESVKITYKYGNTVNHAFGKDL